MTDRSRWGQWAGVSAVAAGMALATVLVPPLIAPDHRPAPSSPPASPTASGSRAPAATGNAPGVFAPIVIEAEDPGNLLTGGAAVTACATCHGGARVRYLCFTCTLVVRTTLPTGGTRTVTVGYEVDGPRSVRVSVNGAPARTFQVTGSEWTTPRSFQFTADLPAGALRLTLFNDETPAPDIDVVTVS
ncbi:hypothetical protein ACFO1B_18055 [Dactylosporangium siamense]|uniref:CBM6 domain-containing protein n=1 Tax=Dactylosporangium siamense TaxID=685454 RepID=A0A919U5X0_9ACTN|nr:hypothetical protein [Dactylosporangium siamense]GIG43779.1 hypothetical protein Dsi01nite_018200 [Dactylosporangium siamense]